jgi:hypothetical protein
LRWFARDLKSELDKEIPSLLLRVSDEKSGNYQSYLNQRYRNVRDLVGNLPTESTTRAQVRLVEFDPDSETKILAGIIFQQTHAGWDSAMATSRELSGTQRLELFEKYMPARSARWYKAGRALENAYLRFEIVMDIGSYRDLHRHRMMTQERQSFTTAHGYQVPDELVHAGLADDFEQALHTADSLFRKLESIDRDLAQYAVPLAYRMRFYQWQNFRQLFWETELRTVSQGHPDYRFIEQEKYRLVKEKFPTITRFMLVDMQGYAIARRGTEERIQEKERSLLEKLRRKE